MSKTNAIGLATTGLSVSQAVVTDANGFLASLAYSTTNTSSTLVQRDASGIINCTSMNGTASKVAATGTITNTSYSLLFSDTSGTPGVVNFDANSGQVTVNPFTNTLTATNFAGNATTATAATNVSTTSTSTNASFFPLFVASSSNSDQAASLSTGLSINPSTNVLTTTGLNLTGLTASYVLTTDASKNLASSNTARVYPFGTITASLDANADTGVTVMSGNINKVAQILVSNNDASHFINLWSGRSTDVNPFLFWSASTNLRFGTCTTPAIGSATQLFLMDSSGNFTASTSITASVGSFVIGTNGGVLQFPLADSDKVLFYNTTNDSKIDTSNGWNTNYRSGATGSASTGIHNWYTVNASNAWTQRVAIQNNGDLYVYTGNFVINTAGKTMYVKEGSNACAGTVTLSGATTTVSTTAAATGDKIFMTVSTVGGTQGLLSYTISNGVSFTITSSTGSLDTSGVKWWIQKAA